MRKLVFGLPLTSLVHRRTLHSQISLLPDGLGRIIKLAPDKKPDESPADYESRSVKLVRKFKEEGDRDNNATLIIRGTIMSPDPSIRNETIQIFINPSPPASIPKYINDSLTAGHISIYFLDRFVSHLPNPIKSQENSLISDVKGMIQFRHHSTMYIVRFTVDAIPGLYDRMNNITIRPYHLKPSENTDNCASAANRILFPEKPLNITNINPLGASDYWLKLIGNQFLDKDSYYKLIDVLEETGISRNLGQVASEEARLREVAIKQMSENNKSREKTEKSENTAGKDKEEEHNSTKGMK